MPVRIVIKNPDHEKPVKMDADPADYIDELIESVADFWELDPKEYLLKKGVTVYSKDSKISDTDIKNDDILEIVKEEDILREKEAKIKELQQAKDWIFDNIGVPQENLVLGNESYDEDNHILIFEDKTDNSKYQLVFDKNSGLKEYRPL